MTERKCEVCKRDLVAWKRRDTKYCGERCQREADRRRKAEQRKVCLVCGAPITRKRSDAVYCSEKCQKTVWNSSRAEWRRERKLNGAVKKKSSCAHKDWNLVPETLDALAARDRGDHSGIRRLLDYA